MIKKYFLSKEYFVFVLSWILFKVLFANSKPEFYENIDEEISIFEKKPKKVDEVHKTQEYVIYNCNMLFESIYLDRSSEKLVKLLFYMGKLEKYQEFFSKKDYISNYIEEERLEGKSRKNLKFYKKINIIFEGEYIKDNFIDLNKCRVKKETGISLFNIGESLLHSAVLSGRLNAVILLIIAGIDVNIKLKKFNRSDLPIFGMVGGYIGDLAGMTPLHYASLIQDLDSIEIIKILLHYGANPNAKDEYKRTPLHIVGLSRNLHPKRITSLLLNAGANIYKKDVSKFTPLHFAASRNNLPVVSLLVSHKTNNLLNEKSIESFVDCNGNTPLHIAAIFNSGDVISFLIREKEDILKANFQGLSPLELSASPFGYRALKTNEVPSKAFSTLQSHLSLELMQEVYENKVMESYFNAIKGGYLQILQKILFISEPINFSSRRKFNFDILKGITLAERKEDKIITNYLKSFGMNIVCPNPPTVMNSNYKLSDTVVGQHIRIGDTVTYECLENYKLIGYSVITCNLSDDIAFYVPEAPSCLEITGDKENISGNTNNGLITFFIIGVIIVLILIGIILVASSRSKRESNRLYDRLHKQI